MEEELIKPETAILAQKKGFKLFHSKNLSEQRLLCTQSLLQRWLREKHDIHIGMTYFNFPGPAYWQSRIHYKNIVKDAPTYEEALELALFYSLEWENNISKGEL